jgi:hypothetical protein
MLGSVSFVAVVCLFWTAFAGDPMCVRNDSTLDQCEKDILSFLPAPDCKSLGSFFPPASKNRSSCQWKSSLALCDACGQSSRVPWTKDCAWTFLADKMEPQFCYNASRYLACSYFDFILASAVTHLCPLVNSVFVVPFFLSFSPLLDFTTHCLGTCCNLDDMGRIDPYYGNKVGCCPKPTCTPVTPGTDYIIGAYSRIYLFMDFALNRTNCPDPKAGCPFARRMTLVILIIYLL